MLRKNVRALENLSLFCHLCGLLIIFFGVFVIILDGMKKEFDHLQIGIFVFIIGYTFVKISNKLTRIILTEKNNNFYA